MAKKYCPKCSFEVTADEQPERLCNVCSWWGDESELTEESTNTAVHLAVEVLDLYRSVCRDELSCEMAFLRGSITLADVKEIKASAKRATYALIAKLAKAFK